MPSPANGIAMANNTQGKYIDGINPDDPVYQREMMRPAEIKEDVKLMEQRKRVSIILNSEAFRRELEEIICSHVSAGPAPDNLVTIQQISDLLKPPTSKTGPISRSTGGSFIPINDLRGGESGIYSKSERLLRCKLTAVYRLVDMFGWHSGIYNHITARISRDHEHFLINPFGLLYHEVTASSLIKIDMKGEVLDQGTTILNVDKAGWLIHSAVHASRSDIRCILHLHTPATVAVSCMKCGLLPLSLEAMMLGEVTYYDPNEDAEGGDEGDVRQNIARALGPTSKILFVRNYGVLACGETVAEMWHYACNAVHACDAQLRLASVGADHLVLPSEEVRQRVFDSAQQMAGGHGSEEKSETGHQWRLGELEFEALMRHLDNQGFRTGYLYHQAAVKQERSSKRHEDVEIPPSSSSFQYTYEEEADPTKAAQKILADRQKSSHRSHWLNTPNTYIREEFEEIGTPNPKKITRWVPAKSEDQPPSSGPVTVTQNPNQFAPQGANPKEFKERQKKVKDKYYKDTNTAGPQSKLLEGVTFEEARRMREEGLAKILPQYHEGGESVVVVGAASKGIIQRDHRHNAVVYQSVYSANPFDKITDDDLEKYKKEVNRKLHPEPEPEPEPEPVPVEIKAQAPPLHVTLDTSIEQDVQMARKPTLASTPAMKAPEEKGHAVQRAESARVASGEREQAPEDLRKKAMLGRSHSDKKATLAAPRTETLRSDTSGAEASHDDTEKEAKDASGKDKKKKRKFKMPSFSKKKDKEKHK